MLSKSPDPQVRSAAASILSQLGGPTRDLVNNPILKGAGKASLVAGFLLNVARYASENDSVIEIVAKSSLNVFFAGIGGMAGEGLGDLACADPETGVGAVVCVGVVTLVGGAAGEQLGEKIGELLVDSKLHWGTDGLPDSQDVFFVLPTASPGPSPTPPAGG